MRNLLDNVCKRSMKIRLTSVGMRRQISDDHRNRCHGRAGPKHHVPMSLQNLNALLQRSSEFVGRNIRDARIQIRLHQIPQPWKSPAARALLEPSRESPWIAAEKPRRNLLILRMALIGNSNREGCQRRRHTNLEEGLYYLLIFRNARECVQMKAEFVRVEQPPAAIPFFDRIGHLVSDRVSFDFRSVEIFQFL